MIFLEIPAEEGGLTRTQKILLAAVAGALATAFVVVLGVSIFVSTKSGGAVASNLATTGK